MEDPAKLSELEGLAQKKTDFESSVMAQNIVAYSFAIVATEDFSMRMLKLSQKNLSMISIK